MRVLRFSIAAATLACLIATVPAARPLAAAGPRESMLTSVSWLADHLKDPNLVLLQVGDEKTYPKEHIPGAQAATMNDFIAPMDHSPQAPADQVMVELPTDDALRKTLQRFGISNDSRTVIVESDDWFSPSTRIYLTLVHAGLGANTTMLDGGLTAWKAAGRPTTTDVPTVKPGTISQLNTVKVTVDAAYVQANAKTPGVVILDVRSPAAWAGVEGIGARGGPQKFGHIPGARSLPLEQLWNDNTGLRPEAELERIFADAGVKPGDTVVGYCYIGQRATATLFAAQSLGHPVFLYDGSMDEWSRLNLPLEMPVKKAPVKETVR
jgi:thiosulfate/3-mercaptopyruvate sulfurtransferase